MAFALHRWGCSDVSDLSLMQCARYFCEIDRYASQAYCLCSRSKGSDFMLIALFSSPKLFDLELIYQIQISRTSMMAFWLSCIPAGRLQDRGFCRVIGIHELCVVSLRYHSPTTMSLNRARSASPPSRWSRKVCAKRT